MYERYAALFALRNEGGDAAVDAIVSCLDANSALLKHEVWVHQSFEVSLLYKFLQQYFYKYYDLITWI